MRNRVLFAIAGFLASAAVTQAASPATAAGVAASSEPFVKSIAAEAVSALATKLDDTYLDPEKGRRYATMLRANLAAGKYSQFSNKDAFAAAVTADLQAVSPDAHLALHVVPPEARSGPGSERNTPVARENTTGKSGWVSNGVAYLELRALSGTDTTLSALRTFVTDHAGAKALIIDLRANHGGGLDEMGVLLPELFAKETVLLAMDTRAAVAARNADPEDAHRASLRTISGPPGVVRREQIAIPATTPRLAATKVYVLISSQTASGAEHFAFALQHASRATLIGETTRGAGNFGKMTPLDNSFTYAAFIPYGRTFDPRTGEGWEGTGVKPDIHVPAPIALQEALRRSGVSVSEQSALAGLH